MLFEVIVEHFLPIENHYFTRARLTVAAPLRVTIRVLLRAVKNMMYKKKWKARLAPRSEQEGSSPSRPATYDPEKAQTKTLQRAVKLLAAKPRSIAELRERLLEKEWTNEEIVDGVIVKLKEYGYLNDERYAFGYASYRVKQKPVGRGRLSRDLRMKKVPSDTAKEVLDLVYEETPEEELIARALKKRVALRGRPQTRAETKSFYDYLLRLGFSPDLVIRHVRDISKAVDEEEEPAPQD